MPHIVLYEPEIPQNTGNIARTCAATGARLHLIRPLGFSLLDKFVKRAGMDYWPLADVSVHDDFRAFVAALPGVPMVFFSTKADKPYTAFDYRADTALVFGPESRGLPETLLTRHTGHCARLPMLPGARSLNLSNAVAVALYEALRQRDFSGLDMAGALTGREEAPLPSG